MSSVDGCVCASSLRVSRRLTASNLACPTSAPLMPQNVVVSPGPSVLTTSFATRGSECSSLVSHGLNLGALALAVR